MSYWPAGHTAHIQWSTLPVNIGLPVFDNIEHGLPLRRVHQTAPDDEAQVGLDTVLGPEVVLQLERVILAVVDTGGTETTADIGLVEHQLHRDQVI